MVNMSRTKIMLLLGLSVAALPASIALAPVTAPLFRIASAVYAKRQEPEESDDDL